MKRKVIPTILVALSTTWLAEGVTHGEEESSPVGSVSLTAASAYVFRGATLNDRTVLQPALGAEVVPGLTLGVWANFDLDRKTGSDQQFSEVDLTLSYALEMKGWSLTPSYAEYLYPNTEAEADREVGLTIALDAPLSPSVAIAYGVGGAVEKSLYIEPGVSLGTELAEGVAASLDVKVGYLVPEEGDSGFSHYAATAGVSFGPAAVNVTYYGQLDDKILSDEAYDTRWVVSLTLSRSF